MLSIFKEIVFRFQLKQENWAKQNVVYVINTNEKKCTDLHLKISKKMRDSPRLCSGNPIYSEVMTKKFEGVSAQKLEKIKQFPKFRKMILGNKISAQKPLANSNNSRMLWRDKCWLCGLHKKLMGSFMWAMSEAIDSIDWNP